MDNQRLFLFIALSFIALMLWEAWQRDYHTPAPAPVASSETAAPAATGRKVAPSITVPSVASVWRSTFGQAATVAAKMAEGAGSRNSRMIWRAERGCMKKSLKDRICWNREFRNPFGS